MNSHISAFHREYRNLIGSVALPAEIAAAYEVCDCLRETAEKGTYLVRSRLDGVRYVLKIAPASNKESLASEYALLCALSHPSIPRAVAFTASGGREYLVREYIEGVSLEQLVSETGPMSSADAIRLILRLCGALRCLHGQNPPVIHRDIKPQNVLRTPQGQCALIDFGIARRFDDAARNDTVCMGTQATAAPEQFGYMQTDVRSDVYSTGVLLLFLLTGSCDPRAVSAITDRALRRIVRRCVRFDPVNRYPSICALQRHLNRALHPARRYLMAAVATVLLVGVGVCAVLFARNSAAMEAQAAPPSPTAEATQTPAASGYTFASPLIGQAVRRQLGLEADAIVTQEDLNRVTVLLICGNRIYDAWEDHYISGDSDYLNGAPEDSVGTVNTLADIAHMPNLEQLALFNQSIGDLSPLKGLHLTKLGLGGNVITDLSILPECGPLTELVLDDNPISDAGPLAAISTLASLDLSRTRVTNIAPITNLPLTFLSLFETPVADYTPLRQLPHLEWIRLSDMSEDQAAICGELMRLKDLTMYRCGISELSALQNLNNLSFLDLLGNDISDIGQIGLFPELRGLCIQDNPVADLTGLIELKNLQYINLVGISATDFSPLAQLPALRTIDCTSEQSERIEQALNGRDVQINVLR